MSITTTERAADAAALTSIPAWLVSVAVDALPVIQALAGLVAIIAGLFAIAVHLRRLIRDR